MNWMGYNTDVEFWLLISSHFGTHTRWLDLNWSSMLAKMGWEAIWTIFSCRQENVPRIYTWSLLHVHKNTLFTVASWEQANITSLLREQTTSSYCSYCSSKK